MAGELELDDLQGLYQSNPPCDSMIYGEKNSDNNLSVLKEAPRF